MAHTIQFLFTLEAAKGRLSRIAGYRKLSMVVPTHVVHVETSSHQFIELDADDNAHALRLVEAWIKTMGKMTARVHEIDLDGLLRNPSKIYDFQDFVDA
jgi:hypothetical protein